MAPSRSAKRPKLDHPQRGDDDYVPGNIVEIELRNFMTYDRLVCRPGPRLNLVVGPNGSGKSSLVCAIALALAADPAILGRAKSVKAFVKRGEKSGHVRLSLRGDATGRRDIRITRQIDTNNNSEWLLDGATVPKKDIIDVIKKFNIQVNNLTQFLPQDRVCDFAKLTPIQLLEETEKAVGDPDLPVQHRQLIERSNELRVLQVSVKQKEQTLNNLKALNAEQEKDVQRARQRDELMKKAELMKKKLPWLKYDIKKAEFLKLEDDEKRFKEQMEQADKIWQDLKAPVEELKKEKMSYVSSTKKITNQINQNAGKRREVTCEEAQLRARLKTTFDDIEDVKSQERSSQQRISTAWEALAAAEKELQDVQPYEPPRDELAQLTNEIAQKMCGIHDLKIIWKEKERQLAQEREKLRKCSVRLKQMESKNNKLLQALERNGAHKISEAYYWVQDNKNMLQREVYGPVLLEVNIQNRTHASYLENHVPKYIWKDASDRDLLVRKLKHYGVPVMNYTGDNIISCKPFNITPEFMNLYQVALVVNSTSSASFYAHEVYRSRYGGHLSAAVDFGHRPRFFMGDLNVSDIESLRSENDELTKKVEGMQEVLRELLKDQMKLEDEEAKIRRQKEVILDMVRSHKKRGEELKRRVGMSLLVEAVALKRSSTEKTMAFIELDTKIWEMEKDVMRFEKDAVQAATKYKNRKRITQEHRQLLLKAKQLAESISMLTEELAKEEFEKMPTTIEELEAAIQDTESEANSMLFLNQNVLQEYQNRQREIESISRKLEDDKVECERCCSEIETTKGKWLPTLRTLVFKINDTFSRNFQEMAVAGEVSLDERGLDFSQYGILIKVKFRQNGQLQVLSAHHQSGGERCFLLTPKLLPDLEYSDACSILNIKNGPWIEKPARAWSVGDCWRKVMGVEAGN
ncbi:hypothetical protein ACQ4PT_043219 [Festuca glaucescens]